MGSPLAFLQETFTQAREEAEAAQIDREYEALERESGEAPEVSGVHVDAYEARKEALPSVPRAEPDDSADVVAVWRLLERLVVRG